jgi:hypothetical protein
VGRQSNTIIIFSTSSAETVISDATASKIVERYQTSRRILLSYCFHLQVECESLGSSWGFSSDSQSEKKGNNPIFFSWCIAFDFLWQVRLESVDGASWNVTWPLPCQTRSHHSGAPIAIAVSIRLSICTCVRNRGHSNELSCNSIPENFTRNLLGIRIFNSVGQF